MAQPPPKFTCFNRLAPELRLKIWKDALPEARIIQLDILTSHTGGSLAPIMSFFSGNISSLDCQVVYRSPSDNHGVLAQVNHEARSVYLKSYQVSDIVELLGPFNRQLYVDFSRDIFYLNARARPTTLRRTTLRRWFTESQEWPIGATNCAWMRAVTQLAIHPTRLSGIYDLDYLIAPPASQLSHGAHRPANRPVKSLLSIYEQFPKLQHLKVVIDGRHTGFSGPAEIVEPPDDDLRGEVGGPIPPGPNALLTVKASFATFLDHIKKQNPNVTIPKTELAVLINGKDNENWERRWKYQYMKCEFVRKRVFIVLDD